MSPKTSPCPDTDNTLSSSSVAPEAADPPSGDCAARAPQHDAPSSTAGSNPSQGQEAKRLTQFEDLPIEIHGQILDHLFGVRGLASGVKITGRRTAQRWSKAMRYQRREHIWCLALVSRTWRVLVQQRIYRHRGFPSPSHTYLPTVAVTDLDSQNQRHRRQSLRVQQLAQLPAPSCALYPSYRSVDAGPDRPRQRRPCRRTLRLSCGL